VYEVIVKAKVALEVIEWAASNSWLWEPYNGGKGWR
jgi:hypothetical protein